MAYTAPTRQEFRNRFGEISAVTDAGVDNLLGLAGRFVDNTWNELDYPLAILYLAGHFAVLARNAATSAGGVGGQGGAGVYLRSIAFSDRRIAYGAMPSSGQSQSAMTTEALASTPYGQVYLMMLRRNSVGVLIV